MRKLAVGSLVLWLVTMAVGAYFFIFGKTTSSPDGRSAIILTADEKNMVLHEMRVILGAVNGVLKAVAKDDMKAAAVSARTAGMIMAVDGDPGLVAKLPAEFKTLGMSLHGDFDHLAGDIDAGLSREQVIERLGTITDKCVACHSGYRISERGEHEGRKSP